MPLGGLLPYNRSGNREDEEDDLLNGMLGDEEPATMPPPVNQAQPMPDLAGTDANTELPGDSPHWGNTNPGQGAPLPGQPGSRNDGIAGGLPGMFDRPGAKGARNDGITGRGSFAPGEPAPTGPGGLDAPRERVAGGAMARYGTGNIPGAENLAWGPHGSGAFNMNEWGEGGTEGYEDSSIKNTFGKIASRYEHNPDSLRTNVMNDPDFKRFFPDAVLIDHPTDPKIDFGDGNPVDVLLQSDQGWQFNPENEAGGGGGGMGGAPGGGVGGLIGMGEQATNPDALAAIMAQIEALQNGQNPMEDDALNEMLR